MLWTQEQEWTYGHHYGDQTLIRDDTVLMGALLIEQADRYALTHHHPAVKTLDAFESMMTEAELVEARELAIA